MPSTRLATPDDTRFIASCLQQLLGSVRRYTIVGCAGLENHIRDLIRGDHQPNSTFILCTDGGAACGVSEWRMTEGRVHLNHIFVISQRRGKGAGSMLLREGLRHFDPSGDALFSVDSFADNRRASDWYASLGLTPAFGRSWRVRPLPTAASLGDVHVDGLVEANQRHRQFGFSQITLEIDGKKYEIGRLGEEYFRTTSAAFLKTPAGLSALSRLDPQRKLLTILADDDEPTSGAIEVARSIRYQTTCGHLRSGLSATLQAVGS